MKFWERTAINLKDFSGVIQNPHHRYQLGRGREEEIGEVLVSKIIRVLRGESFRGIGRVSNGSAFFVLSS
jgi:hypothetical protein